MPPAQRYPLGARVPPHPHLPVTVTLIPVRYQDFRATSHPCPSRTHSHASMTPRCCPSPALAMLRSPVLGSSTLQSTNPLLHLCNVHKCPQQSRVKPPREEMNQFRSVQYHLPKHSHWGCPGKAIWSCEHPLTLPHPPDLQHLMVQRFSSSLAVPATLSMVFSS